MLRAQVHLSVRDRLKDQPDGNYIVVTGPSDSADFMLDSWCNATARYHADSAWRGQEHNYCRVRARSQSQLALSILSHSNLAPWQLESGAGSAGQERLHVPAPALAGTDIRNQRRRRWWWLFSSASAGLHRRLEISTNPH